MNMFQKENHYGPNVSENSGDNIYFLDSSELRGWNCIWDNGGEDTISAINASSSSLIDLRNASLKNEKGGGGYISQVGNETLGYTIAFNSTGNCVIENAIGSRFGDRILGNSIANSIVGNSGNDIIKGLSGNDILNGGSGNDTINGGSGQDTAVFSAKSNRIKLATRKKQNTRDGKDILIGIENVNAGGGNDIVIGSKSGNVLNGESGNDRLTGAGGNDIFYGGDGNDRLVGGTGQDTAVFSDKSNRITLATRKKQNTRSL